MLWENVHDSEAITAEKTDFLYAETWKDGSTCSLVRVSSTDRERDVNFWQVSRQIPQTSCLHVALKVLSISEETRFEIASCAGFYTAKRPAQSIFVENGEVFTRDSDINLHRFFFLVIGIVVVVTWVWRSFGYLRFSSLYFLSWIIKSSIVSNMYFSNDLYIFYNFSFICSVL